MAETPKNQIPESQPGIDTPAGINAFIESNVNNNIPPPLSDPTNAMTTVENMLPFDGQPLMAPVGLPGPSVQANVTGSPDNILGGSGAASQQDMDLYIRSQVDGINQDSQNNQYAKTFQYDAGPKTSAFYDRYAAYGDDKFSEVGFHPFIDNEANFNNNTTMWDDWGRMLQHSFPALMKRGFIDGPKSLAKMVTGNFNGADLRDAEEYAEKAAIGMSTKEGVSAFFNNTVMNFGYTAGIITEAILEEVVLSALTIGSAGTTSGVQAARTGMLGANIMKALGKFGSGAKEVTKLLSKVSKNPAAARPYWNALKSAGKVVNPLENTFGAVKGVVQSRRAFKAGKADSYINGLGAFSKTVGGFYRDVRNVNMAVSEARLEAGMVENDIYKELYDDHYNEKKTTPTNEDQVAMRIRAKQGSLETFYGNAGLIYLTNQITFRNIVAPKGGIANFMKSVRKDLYSVEGKFGSLGKVVYNRSKQAFAFEKNNLINLGKSWWKQPGLTTAKKTLGYFKANVSEGIQENLQETIARANIKHYVEAYKTQAVSKSMYARGVNGVTYSAQMGTSGDAYFDELKKEFSPQGFETFMSGFMMGTFAKPLNSAVPFLSAQYNKIYDNAEYQKWKDSKSEVMEGVVKQLNDLSSKKGVREILDNRLFNLGTQEAYGDIMKYGSKKEALDAQVDAFVESTRLMRKYNSMDSFVDKLETMSELTDAELVDAIQGIDLEKAPKYRERIASAIDKFKNIDKLYEQAEKLFPNPVNLNTLDINLETLKDPKVRAQLALHQAWEESVKNFVYFNESFKDTAKRMNSIYSNYLKDNVALESADYGAAKVLFKTNDIVSQLGILKQELSQENIDPKRARYLKEQVDLLQKFQTSQKAFDQFYNREEYYKQAEKMLKADGIKEPTEEQVLKKIKEGIPDITDQDAQQKIHKDLKTAHDAYIRSIADYNDTTIFQSEIDNAYNGLLDYYKLGSEKRFLAESIDILSDPGQFLDLVEAVENEQERLQKLTDALNRQLADDNQSNVEFEALLNKLANNTPPLYFTKEEGVDLMNNKVIPKTLSGKQQEVYDQESDEYKAGLVLINQYLGLQPIRSANINPISKTQMTPEMKEALEEANRVFAKSKEYSNLIKKYLREGKTFDRVSNVVQAVLKDSGYAQDKIGDLVNDDLSFFNTSFKNGKLDEDDKLSIGPFVFNEETISEYVDTVGKYNEGLGLGFNEIGLTKLKAELLAVLNGEVLPSNQESIDKIKEQLKKAGAKDKPALEAELNNLETDVVTEPTEENVKTVIENVLPKITFQSARDRGNIMDDLVRDFFDSTLTEFKYDESKITKVAFEKIFGENGFLRPLRDLQESGEIIILSKDLTLGNTGLVDSEGKPRSVAGTLDLFIIDKKGNKYIIDLKTGSKRKWREYTIPNESDDAYDYKKFFQNSLQQRAYSNMYFNESNGSEVPAYILPIVTTENKQTGKIMSAEGPLKNTFIGQTPLFTKDPMFIEVPNEFAYKDKSLKDVDAIVPKGDVQKESGNSKKRSKEQKRIDKRIDRYAKDLSEAQTVEDKVDAIHKFNGLVDFKNKNVFLKLSIDQEAIQMFDEAMLDLNAQGYYIGTEQEGDVIVEGSIIDIDSTDLSDEIVNGESIDEADTDFTVRKISKIIKPKILLGNELYRRAKVNTLIRFKTVEELESKIKGTKSLITALKSMNKPVEYEQELVEKLENRVKLLKGEDGPIEKAEFTVEGDVITLGPNQFIVSQVLPDNVEGKLIYATPGTGKSTFINESSNDNFIDADDIMIDEIMKAGFRPRKKGESAQDYIGEFSYSGANQLNTSKSDINNRVLTVINGFKANGKTVFTGTLKFLKDSDILIIGTETSVPVQDRLGSGLASFIENQKNLVEAFKNKTPFETVFEDIRDKITTTTDTLSLYNEIAVNEDSNDLTYDEAYSLKNLLDRKATALTFPNASSVLSTSSIYTFVNSVDKIASGQEITVVAIDSLEENIIFKKAGKGNFKAITMSAEKFVYGLMEKEDSPTNQGGQDETTTNVVDNTLSSDEKISKLNNSKSSFKDLNDTENDEDIFGCD